MFEDEHKYTKYNLKIIGKQTNKKKKKKLAGKSQHTRMHVHFFLWLCICPSTSCVEFCIGILTLILFLRPANHLCWFSFILLHNFLLFFFSFLFFHGFGSLCVLDIWELYKIKKRWFFFVLFFFFRCFYYNFHSFTRSSWT